MSSTQIGIVLKGLFGVNEYLFPIKGEIISTEKVSPVDTLIHICLCGLEEEAGNEELQAQRDGWME